MQLPAVQEFQRTIRHYAASFFSPADVIDAVAVRHEMPTQLREPLVGWPVEDRSLAQLQIRIIDPGTRRTYLGSDVEYIRDNRVEGRWRG